MDDTTKGRKGSNKMSSPADFKLTHTQTGSKRKDLNAT